MLALSGGPRVLFKRLPSSSMHPGQLVDSDLKGRRFPLARTSVAVAFGVAAPGNVVIRDTDSPSSPAAGSIAGNRCAKRRLPTRGTREFFPPSLPGFFPKKRAHFSPLGSLTRLRSR